MHKIWQTGTTALLLIIVCHLVMLGFFRPKLALIDHSEPFETDYDSDRKVVMLLVDALREDFVEFDTNTHTYLDSEADYAYKGKKLQLFKNMKENEPDNTLLFPLISEMPTVTNTRVKGLLSGSLTTFFDVSDEFLSGEASEDSVLWQLKHKKYKKGEEPKIVFYGDYIWDGIWGQYFDKSETWESLDISNLDSHDDSAQARIYEELDAGSDFTIMMGHIIGLDCAGHTHMSQHPEIERKILDSERIIKNIIDKIDDKTTLVVFGDHGMTVDGNHGGPSL